MSDSNNSDTGIGVFGVLGIIFVVLKLLGIIKWSWWWVTAPFWIGPALAISIFLIYVSVLFVMKAMIK